MSPPETDGASADTSSIENPSDSSIETPIETLIEVSYPRSRGPIGLRGSHAPLSWEETTPPVAVKGDRHLFRIPLRADDLLELKVVHGEDWASGPNYVVHAGDHVRIDPYFARRTPTFEPPLEIPAVAHQADDGQGARATIEVLLPPSYEEQPNKRYPVLYVLDGQSLWTHSRDPFGTWDLDATVGSLYELGAIEELIVVGIDTSEARLDRLSPVADDTYGGGGGPAFLEHIVGPIRDAVNARYRTRIDAASTGILGSSMGGLFAFYAAWSRPDVFGKAACLSSSFWWANRWAVRLVQSAASARESTPSSSKQDATKPLIYLDSGASPAPMEEDARVIDGFHHTRSMHRALTRAGFDMGAEVHRLVFPGHAHHAASWASRVALPLQLLFPRIPLPVDEASWA